MSADLPPILLTQFELHVGTGYQLLGHTDAAKSWFERALATASKHSFNQFVFAAEEALLGTLAPRTARFQAPTIDIPRDVERIAAEISELRRLTGAR